MENNTLGNALKSSRDTDTRNAYKELKNWKSRSPKLLPSLNTMGEDGVDHINIWVKAKTKLGKSLDKSSWFPFTHRPLGKFKTIDGIWHFVGSVEHDDNLRTLYGKGILSIAKSLTRKHVVNFRTIILDSIWQRINAFPEIKKELEESTLPFDCWYISSRTYSIRTRPGYASWFLPAVEEMRKAVKENRDPDFKEWMDNPRVGIYDDILKDISENFQTEKEVEV